MYTVWHVDKYKITFKLVINWTNEILWHIVVSSGPSRPSIIDARARYRAAVRRLRNISIGGWMCPSAGLDGCRTSDPYTGFRSPDCPARSESLYRLSYPGRHG